jgi:translation initiation factor 1
MIGHLFVRAQKYTFICYKHKEGMKNVVYLITHLNIIHMKGNDWKDRLNIVYSTNRDFEYESYNEEEEETLPKDQQKLRVSIEKKGRGGKTVTLIKGFVGTEDDLKELAKSLKSQCGVGGTAKEGEIIIQGEFKQRIIDILKTKGYTQTK